MMYVSRVYPDVNTQQPKDYWDYENYSIKWGKTSNFEINDYVGRGKYSDVFEGFDKTTGNKCIIKALKPVRKNKMKREVKVLENLRGGPNIVELIDIVRDEHCSTRALILEHLENEDYKELYDNFTDHQAKKYLFEVLKAIEYAHSHGIMHRDIKPHNIMYNPSKDVLRIIDWGLAEFYHPGKEYNVRVASRYFKAPELLAGFTRYDYSVDMWAFGCLLGSIIFRTIPLFKGSDNNDQLEQINKILGTEEFFEYLEKFKIKLPQQYSSKLKAFPKKEWSSFISDSNSHLCSSDAVDLLSRLLVYDHSKRLSANEAMKHSYFNDLK
ncbi:casein kinase ii subunit alpha [Anaeramoeba ignava]|uniref:non-specific serine/threonine protein kinase n=1 Tax=Anaeramoeba ignava TaxID=1746090 RepID=A0A9Q0LJ27_ANAIG|nr:casein kinase ii subunit alpha [Anaeramoeba ignava]|eukprot:Anaeramoba_ignava/a91977_92.p1 GENE.a91977_92~~a91977_92.p1  ORF type:complete len:325 (-),score=58.06 a91977_92:40-1014(-)